MFVLKSTYNAMEARALKAEARVAEFERAAEAQTVADLAAYNKKTKKSKKIEVKDGTETVPSTSEHNNGLGDSFIRNASGKLPMSKAAVAARQSYVQNAVNNGATVAEVVNETGLTESSVRSFIKK